MSKITRPETIARRRQAEIERIKDSLRTTGRLGALKYIEQLEATVKSMLHLFEEMNEQADQAVVKAATLIEEHLRD